MQKKNQNCIEKKITIWYPIVNGRVCVLAKYIVRKEEENGRK